MRAAHFKTLKLSSSKCIQIQVLSMLAHLQNEYHCSKSSPSLPTSPSIPKWWFRARSTNPKIPIPITPASERVPSLQSIFKKKVPRVQQISSQNKSKVPRHVAKLSKRFQKFIFQPCCKPSIHFNNSCCKRVALLQLFFNKLRHLCF